MLAQSIIAASRTVDEGSIHSLHSYFLRAGDAEAPIVYNVERNRDGRSFKSRRVVAIQHGRPIFTLAASFQLEQEGLDHQFEMPDVPMPEDLSSESDVPEDRLEQVPPLLRAGLHAPARLIFARYRKRMFSTRNRRHLFQISGFA